MKKKIIQVLPALNVGGAETLVKEYLLHFDPSVCDAQALILGARNHSVIEKALAEHNVKTTYLPELYHVSHKLPRICRRFLVAYRWRNALKKYFKKEKPDILHCHLSVANKIIAAKSCLKRTKLFYTVHSDPDKYWGGGNEKAEQKAIRYFVRKNGMHMFALNKESAVKLKQYFGSQCSISLLNNGIDFEKYRLPQGIKNDLKKNLGLPEESFIVGHVGRFFEPKNHDFIIDVFHAICQKQENAFLLLVGDGKLMKKTEEKVKALNLSHKVLFLGNRSDVNKILSVFDVFLFPSLWEGFPITLIEAQAAKLPCFVSDTVNHEVKLTNLVTFISLEQNAEEWATKILTHENQKYVDSCLSQYDITCVMKILLEIYGVTEKQDFT